MPEDQDKANEACLTEFEFHDYATSESRTDFCCFAYKRGDSIEAVFLVKSESLEDSTEEIEVYYSEIEAVTYGAALLEYVAPESTEEDEDDEDEDEEEAARVGAISLAAITASMFLYIQ